MQRVAVTRLYKDTASQQTVLLMEATESREEITLNLAWHKAGVLALEAHGLNDRCPLYSMLLACVKQLGGALEAVLLTKDDGCGASAAISLSKDGRAVWIRADAIELIALALHLQLPIYVSKGESRGAAGPDSQPSGVEIPKVFHEAFSEDHHAEPDADSLPAPGD